MKALLIFTLLMSTAAWAEIRSVKLSIPSMNCVMCTFTVRKALKTVAGVSKVDVDYKTKSALVVYDDQKASVARLEKATNDAGYPSTEIRRE